MTKLKKAIKDTKEMHALVHIFIRPSERNSMNYQFNDLHFANIIRCFRTKIIPTIDAICFRINANNADYKVFRRDNHQRRFDTVNSTTIIIIINVITITRPHLAGQGTYLPQLKLDEMRKQMIFAPYEGNRWFACVIEKCKRVRSPSCISKGLAGDRSVGCAALTVNNLIISGARKISMKTRSNFRLARLQGRVH